MRKFNNFKKNINKNKIKLSINNYNEIGFNYQI